MPSRNNKVSMRISWCQRRDVLPRLICRQFLETTLFESSLLKRWPDVLARESGKRPSAVVLADAS